MKCASCGKESEWTVCGRCLAKRESLVYLPPVITLIRCPKCKFFKVHGKFVNLEFNKALWDEIERRVRIHEEFIIKNFEIIGDGHFYTYIISGEVRNDNIEFNGNFEVRINKELCIKCSRESGGYYEAIIQLRADNRKLRKHEVDSTIKIIHEMLEKEIENQKAFLTKVEERKEGFDFYLGDSKIAKKVARKISNLYGAKIVESKKLAGKRDGVDFYRVTYLVRFPEFEKGDVVFERGRYILVTNVKKGIDILSGEKVNLNEGEVIAKFEELGEGVIVNVDDTAIEVYGEYAFIAKKPEYEVKIGDEVLFFRDGEKFFAFPKWFSDLISA